ncbi:MAG TPA: hypothetical protein VGP82_05135, partial [Ktedonobacterales bacterium]|nr:hypothetical protein [Ktedonobacterales bacterium]
MFAGHFGLAAGVKALDSGVFSDRRAAPQVNAAMDIGAPLWALMLATQLLDVIFVPLVLLGVESFGGSTGYGEGTIRAYYTHSLVGALLIALVAGALAWRAWGQRSGLIVAGVVFSHWLLDLLVHRPDLPILPGNLGNLPMFGFGLWNLAAISASLELLLIVVGGGLYAVSALRRARNTPQP